MQACPELVSFARGPFSSTTARRKGGRSRGQRHPASEATAQPPSRGEKTAGKTKAATGAGRDLDCACATERARVRVAAGPGPKGGVGKGRSQPGGRRPLWAGCSRAPTGGRRRRRPRRTHCPPRPWRGRAPAARACAALGLGLGSAPSGWCARSQSPPPTSSHTGSSAAAAHLLPPPPQTPSPLLSSTVLVLRLQSGKREALNGAAPSAPCARTPPAQRWVS